MISEKQGKDIEYTESSILPGSKYLQLIAITNHIDEGIFNGMIYIPPFYQYKFNYHLEGVQSSRHPKELRSTFHGKWWL